MFELKSNSLNYYSKFSDLFFSYQSANLPLFLRRAHMFDLHTLHIKPCEVDLQVYAKHSSQNKNLISLMKKKKSNTLFMEQ